MSLKLLIISLVIAMLLFAELAWAALDCPRTRQYNVSGKPWNKADRDAKVEAGQMCYDRFKEESPCLVQFVKQGDRKWQRFCGTRDSRWDWKDSPE